MNFEYKHLLPTDFDKSSRVWIYQSNRFFMMSEALTIEEMMEDFINNWKTHGEVVKGYANMFFGQFIIIMADESRAGVSGCSTDSSVRLIKLIEEKFKVDMFNRQNLAFVQKEKVQLIPLSQLSYAYENDFINGDTIYFNNLVNNKKELETKWMIPLKESWLVKKISMDIYHKPLIKK